MTIDLYTKVILTVIAIALSASVFQNSFGSAVAQNGVQRVVICDYKQTTTCARVGGNTLDSLSVY